MSSCSDGTFGGDFEVGNTELVDMAGTWCCTVEANDAYLTTQYYIANGYTSDFLNSYFGDPYGYYNPDVNSDGVVDLTDLESDEYAQWWGDFYGNGVVEFRTFNTAANNTTEMWLEDANYWATQTKVNVDLANMTFEAPGTVVQDADQVETAPGVFTTLSELTNTGNDVAYGCGVVILGGKILKGAAHAPGSGMQTDSIIFYIKYDDDYGKNVFNKVSGYRKTGYTEDD